MASVLITTHYMGNASYWHSAKLAEMRHNSKCRNCGADGRVTEIEFHHVDPATKTDAIRAMIRYCHDWSAIEAELIKCVPLCTICHKKLHRKWSDIERELLKCVPLCKPCHRKRHGKR